MSSYIEFYLRKGENYLPLGAWSRNSKLYEVFKDFAEYGVATPITRKIISMIYTNINENITDLKKQIKKCKKSIKFFNKSHLSYEDLIEGYNSFQLDIEDYKEELTALKRTKAWAYALNEILLEAESTCYEDDESLHINPDEYIYVGIDCGNPQSKTKD